MKFLICTLILFSFAIAPTHAKAETPPNIVLLLSDDQAWTDYSFMGHEAIQTPNLDALARRSAVFRRGYVPTALCRPSLATLLTGHYASTHGITGNDPSPKYAKPDSKLYDARRAQLISYLDRFDTVPELLGKRGYLSHQSGKLWEGSYTNAGFTDGMTRGFPNPGGRHGDDGLTIGRQGIEPIAEFVDKAVAAKKPFFLWYAPFLPHSPHNPPERILSKYKTDGRTDSVAKYFAMCEWFDETCGDVMKLIDDKGQRDNTLFVYLTDNGWIQDPNSSKYAMRSKQTPYEGGIRTPIMYSWPGKIIPGERTELATSLDIAPTMLAAAGQTIPDGLPGLNLLPNLETGAAIERDRIFGESFAHDVADIENPEASLLFRWVIEGKWKLLLTYDGETNRYTSTHPRTEKGPQLFDLIADPAEKTNLASDNPKVVAKLAREIEKWYPVKERKTITSAP
ncbi:sulfatase-like hydrolase/transferase [Rubripirellula reticaptiva]|uniref:Arylsulfatase n=1 Tax=Rubripirellula reticaptiva TaxID=2528013 RepID=A0A5C6EDF9_9BACT|nr:sulfatase-like hydrolase/transferase [Rubripirellula reticaptiva]TWU47072.1 Arylsulfatase [Rubripirellula reticaptiva]